MIELIAKALADYQEKGEAVIAPPGDIDANEVGHYVLTVLHGLRCDFSHYYHCVENAYFIFDNQ